MKTLDIVIPVYNEEGILDSSIQKIRCFCDEKLDYDWRIVIANNASLDNTLAVAKNLEKKYSDVRVVHLNQKGRGRALKKAWLESDADFRSYMDVDLSSDLQYLPLLIDSLREGYDISTGSRLMRSSSTERSLTREILSRGYNMFIKTVLLTNFSDAQCGFKAITRKAAMEMVPMLRHTQWFFDTELLVLAEKLGYRIKDIPIRWIEDKDSRVNILHAVLEDISGVLGLKYRLLFEKDSLRSQK